MASAVVLDLRCLSCPFKTNSEENFLAHSRIHQHEFNFRIRCFFCARLFDSMKAHKKHTNSCQPEMIPPTKCDEDVEITILQWQCKKCLHTIETRNKPNIKDFDAVTDHIFGHESLDCQECNSSHT